MEVHLHYLQELSLGDEVKYFNCSISIKNGYIFSNRCITAAKVTSPPPRNRSACTSIWPVAVRRRFRMKSWPDSKNYGMPTPGWKYQPRLDMSSVYRRRPERKR